MAYFWTKIECEIGLLLQSLDILLRVPPNNAVPTDIYRLHVEGYKKGEGKVSNLPKTIMYYGVKDKKTRLFLKGK